MDTASGRPRLRLKATANAVLGARTITALIRPTGESFTRAFAWGAAEPSTVTVIEPIVVEVDADASARYGTLRHAARLVRVRADLDPADLDTGTR